MPDQANDPIDDLATCLGKDLVAFINQPNPWGRCYAYPQYALTGTGAEHIDATKVFPDKGCLPVTLVGHETAEYARDELGDIAILRLNAAPQEQAERYYKKDHNRYFTKFRLPDADRDSFATLMPLREEQAGGGLVEVVGLGEEWDFSTRREGAFRPYKIPRRILTDVVVVSPRSEFMHRVFGPFRATRDRRGGLYLRALEEFDYQISSFDYYDWENFLIVNDRKRHALASFVTMDELRSRMRQSPTSYDWMPDDALLDLLKNANEARQQAAPDLDPAAQDNEDVLGALAGIPEGLRLSEARAGRLRQLVSDRAKWEGVFRDFDTQLVQSREELESTLSRLEEEVGQRQAERDALAEECADLEARAKGEAERFGNVISEQADAVAKRLADGASLTQDILQSEVLKRVISQIERPSTLPEEAALPTIDLRTSRSTASAAEIIDGVYDSLRKRPVGAQLTRNDVINLLICLTQGTVTVLSGPSGTGKASLVRDLADALGLTTGGASRFCEVPAGYGWKSCHDLLGSPCYLGSGPNAQVMRTAEVFCSLDREARAHAKSEVSDAAPFLFLVNGVGQGSTDTYLSPFLRERSLLSSGETKSLSEDGRCLTVPQHVRLIATSDTDTVGGHAPMHLSGRTWTITLEPWDIDLSDAFAPDETARPQSPTTFSMATLGKAFGFHGKPLQDADATKLSEVIGCCREHGAPLSPLTQRMMRDYVAVASRLMGTGEAEGEHVAVDYAVSQKVVPLAQAANTPRKTDLVEALGRIEALPRSTAALDALG